MSDLIELRNKLDLSLNIGRVNGVTAYPRQLTDLLSMIKSGHLQLPVFQRHEAWKEELIEGLIETVLFGLPAGALLIWQVQGQSPFETRPLQGVTLNENGVQVNELILDGQQRLTALWKSLHDSYEEQSYFVCLNDRTDSEFARVISIVNQANNSPLSNCSMD